MRLGILAHGFIGWGGGIDFLRIVCSSLQATGRVELHLLLPTRGPRLQIKGLIRHSVRFASQPFAKNNSQASVPGRPIIEEFAHSSGLAIQVHEIDIGRRALRSAARRLELDALVPSIAPIKGATTPWVGYIPDFQHRYFPELFSVAERRQRDRRFLEIVHRARAVVVNSKAVERDIHQFLPGRRAEIFSLPFSAAPDPKWFDFEPELGRFGIRAPYFIISNQFWVHKDHLTAFRAFALVRKALPNVDLVCTGSTSDYRNTSHFDSLMSAARELGLVDNLKVLGMIAKKEQIGLMRGAVAVLQPTLFEGGPGGGSVYDAVSLGVPAIVSDIPVNRELNDPAVSMFPAGDHKRLAEAMIHCLGNPVLRNVDRDSLIARGIARRKLCGMALLDALEQCRV